MSKPDLLKQKVLRWLASIRNTTTSQYFSTRNAKFNIKNNVLQYQRQRQQHSVPQYHQQHQQQQQQQQQHQEVFQQNYYQENHRNNNNYHQPNSYSEVYTDLQLFDNYSNNKFYNSGLHKTSNQFLSSSSSSLLPPSKGQKQYQNSNQFNRKNHDDFKEKSFKMYNEIFFPDSITENQINDAGTNGIIISDDNFIGQSYENMMYQNYHQNATTFLNSKNISFADFNITSENLDDFLHKLKEIISEDKCKEYCKGTLRDWMLRYTQIHGYMSLLVCIFGTIANILNIIVLTKKDMAKTPINRILKWLAVADMFVMIEYIPFTTFMYLLPSRDYFYGHVWAIYLLFHMHFSQILHTISILLTVTLAIWRFVAIRHPHGSFASYLLSHCGECILISFIASPILCFPTYFVFRVNEKDSNGQMNYYVGANEDTALYSFNFWVHSVLIKLLPCCVLTLISFVLMKVLCEASKRKIKLKEYSNPKRDGSQLNGHRPSKCDRRPDRTTMLLVAVLFLFLITEFPQGILGLLSGILKKCFFRKCYSLFGELMDLLALINAAIGFVLYGLMSKQFRTNFKSLFFKTRSTRNEMTRMTGITTTCV